MSTTPPSITWPPCPPWCDRNPSPDTAYNEGGHWDDTTETGEPTRIHQRIVELPESDRPDSAKAVELEATEYHTPNGIRLGPIYFLIDTADGQYLSPQAATAAAHAIAQLSTEISTNPQNS